MPITDTWLTLTEAMVQDSINDSELEANLTTASASGQAAASIIGDIMADVTSEVRGYCRRRNTLGAEGTIPAELKNAAIDIVLYRVCQRVSGATAAKAREKSNDDAFKKLDKVADGIILLSAPQTLTTTVTTAPSPAMETVTGAGINGPYPEKRRRFGPHEEHGI